MMAKYIQYTGTANLLGATTLVSSFIISDDNGTLNNLNYTFDARQFSALVTGKAGPYAEMKFNHNKLQLTTEYSEFRDISGNPDFMANFVYDVCQDVATFIP